jgi:hypothetical protein
VVLPLPWLDQAYSTPPFVSPSAAPVPASVDAESLALDSALIGMICGSRALRTLQQHRIPFLKLALWLLVRGLPVAPPQPRAVGRFLTALVVDRRNKSAAPLVVRALSFVCWLNSWPSMSSSVFLQIPQQAAAAEFSGPPRKVAPIETWMIAAILLDWARPEQPEWKFMLAVAFLVCYMTVARYDDLTYLQWGPGYYTDEDTFLSFYFEKRKNDQLRVGHSVDVACLSSGESCFNGVTAGDYIRRGAARFGSGAVLRNLIWRRGVLVLDVPFTPPRTPSGAFVVAGLESQWSPRYLSSKRFRQFLRQALFECCGIPKDTAVDYTGHSLRVGAGTCLVQQGVAHHVIMNRAGVTSADWIRTYDRVDLDRRLEASRALAL